MPSRYAARHRAVAPAARGRHRGGARGTTARSLFRPLSVSAVSLGVTLVLVQTATSFGDMTRANAAANALVATASTDTATPAVQPLAATTPAASAPLPGEVDDVTRATKATSPVRPTASRTPPAPTVDAAKAWTMPVAGVQLSSTYGSRWGAMHRGIDLAGPIGLPLKAMSSGVVTFAGQQSGYGNLVQIKYWDGTVSYYGHMNALAVRTGQQVTPGQVVGELGNTGQSTGPHCHLEVHPSGGSDIDPMPWLSAHGLAVS